MPHRTRRRRDRLLALAAALMPMYGFAQVVAVPPVDVLPGIEVIGTTPLPGSTVPKDRVPADVQTATSSDLDRTHVDVLMDFLKRRSQGVYVNEIQNNPFQPDVNYRGFTASPLLGTPQGLSVYVDGVRINQPFGDVVSWDLLPRAAIDRIVLNPGSNPIFGLNTLGGALVVTTKDGLTHPGSSLQLTGGSYGRAAIEFETGGSAANGLDWYVTGNRFHDSGWRHRSSTNVEQLFGKIGWHSASTRVALSAGVARNDLWGNGLQEQRLLAVDRASAYTYADVTKNRAEMLNLVATRDLTDALSLSGNLYFRSIRTSTRNDDANDDSLDQSVYQPSAAEQGALAAAGYSGFPASGANASNTPFPIWRCIANKILNDEPAEKCTGVINSTYTRQRNEGLSGQLNWKATLMGRQNALSAGAAFDTSRVRFTQQSELGYLNSDRSVTGVGAFGDGGITGGTVDGEPYDTRVDLSGRTRTWSVFAMDVLEVAPKTHVTVSGRYNHTRVDSRNAIVPRGGPGSLDGNHSFNRFNPAVGVTSSPLAAIGVYAGYAEGSRAPSAIELGCADPANPCKLPNAFAGDPPLKQVVARTLEAGVRSGPKGPVQWNVGVFRTDSRDDILFVANNQTGFGYFKNFGRTRRQGVEAAIDGRLAGLHVGANYTLLDATYRSAETVDGSNNSSNDQARAGFPGVEGTIRIEPGDRIPLIPRHLFKAFADYALLPSCSVGIDMIAVGRSFARGNENNQHQASGPTYLGGGTNGGYAVFNIGVDYRPTRQVKLFAQVNNLFDRGYSTAAQLGSNAFTASGTFQARPFAANRNGDFPLQHSTFYAPGAPRTFVVGLRYAFAD